MRRTLLAAAAVLTLGVGCAAIRAPRPPALAQSAPPPFTSNGCSGFREATFFSCCFVHDFNYWSGGTWNERTRADRTLRACILTISGERGVADIAYFLIRLGILPGSLMKDGWGRAWYGMDRKRYAPLTGEQRARVEGERARVCASLRVDTDTGWFFVDDARRIRPRQARELCGGDPLDGRGGAR